MSLKRKQRIAIILELKKRELPFLVILKSLLEKNGYKVKFISFRNHCTISLMMFRPDIIMINGLRTTYSPFVSQIYLPKKLFKSKILCYYSEQVGLYDQTVANGYDNPLILRNIDCHVSWGRRFSKDLISMGVNPDKSWFIGSMQYDLDYYLQKNSQSLRNEFEKKLSVDSGKKWLLYCDNIMKRYTNPDIYSIRREESFNIIRQLAKKNMDSVIFFRPHPETSDEEVEDMRKFFSSYQNVIVNADGHLFYWIMACDGLLIWQSTSAIQSMFLKKPVFGFKLSDGQNENLYWYKDMIPTYDNHNLLVEEVTEFLRTGKSNRYNELAPSREKYIQDFYFRKDGLSFNRLIELFDRLNLSPCAKYDDEEFDMKRIIKLFLYEIKMWLKNGVHGRLKEFSVSKKEIQEELSKYNLGKYKLCKFRTLKTEDGLYLEDE